MTGASGALLAPDELSRLARLARKLSPRVRSGLPGDLVARRRGAGTELADRRAYEAGDDPRRIDWSAYARTGAPHVKLFHGEEDQAVYVLLDTSRSLGFGAPTKLEVARRVSLAVAYVALCRGARVEILAAGDDLVSCGVAGGRDDVGQLSTALKRLEPAGKLDLRARLAGLGRRSPGWIVVVSDFLGMVDPAPVLERLAARDHEIGLLQVLSHDDVAPDLRGDVTLVDAETGEEVMVTADATLLAEHASALARLTASLEGVARRCGGAFTRVVSNEGVVEVVDRFLARKGR